MMIIELAEYEDDPVRYYVETILDTWEQATAALFYTGQRLIEAKKNLPHGNWMKVVKQLPFSLRTAEKLMALAADHRLRSTPESILPSCVATLYEIRKLPELDYKKACATRKIHSQMTFREARALTLKTAAQTRHKRAADQNVGRGVSLWLADPPWSTSFDVPYQTMSIEAIKELRLRPDGTASRDPKYPTIAEASAPSAAIGLWAIDELLHEAEDVLVAWGFELLHPRIIWNKESHVRAGRAALMQHEYLLIGVRGNAEPVPPKPGSVITLARRKLANSEKPIYFHSMMRKMFPRFVKRVELFARRVPPPGWQGWGNQYPGVGQQQSAA